MSKTKVGREIRIWVALAVIVLLTIFSFAYFPSYNTEGLLRGDGELRHFNPKVKWFYMLIPVVQGKSFWEDQKSYYIQKLRNLEEKGPPDVERMAIEKVNKFDSFVERSAARLENNLQRDDLSEKSKERRAEIFERMVEKRERGLRADLNEISALTQAYHQEISDLKRLILIIDKKI